MILHKGFFLMLEMIHCLFFIYHYLRKHFQVCESKEHLLATPSLRRNDQLRLRILLRCIWLNRLIFWFRVGTCCYFGFHSCRWKITKSPDFRFDFSDLTLLFSSLLKSWASTVAASKSTSLAKLLVVFPSDLDLTLRIDLSCMFPPLRMEKSLTFRSLSHFLLRCRLFLSWMVISFTALSLRLLIPLWLWWSILQSSNLVLLVNSLVVSLPDVTKGIILASSDL